MKGRRYKLWWSGKGDEVGGGVGVMVKGEMCEKVVEVEMVGDRVMSHVVLLDEDVLRLICGYNPQVEEVWRKSFYDELKCELDIHYADDLIMCLDDFIGYIGRHNDVFDGMNEDMV